MVTVENTYRHQAMGTKEDANNLNNAIVIPPATSHTWASIHFN